MDDVVSMMIGPHTRYIVSTSGRLSSMKRYKKLLQEILHLDIAYIPIHSNNADYEDKSNILKVKIEPQQ